MVGEWEGSLAVLGQHKKLFEGKMVIKTILESRYVKETLKTKYRRDQLKLTALLAKKVNWLVLEKDIPRLSRIQEIVSLATDLERSLYVAIEAERILREK